MSQRQLASSRRHVVAPPPSQLREILTDIARWALTSSIGLSAACGNVHGAGALSQPVPPPANLAGSGVGSAGSGSGVQSPAVAIGSAGTGTVEGCVRETYGALVAHYQASSARDLEVRAAMQVIAEDETRHASLAWHVARWLEPRLSGEARLILQAARSAALAQLLRELDSGLTLEERTTIGWPANEIAAQMILRLGTSLAKEYATGLYGMSGGPSC